MSRKKKSRSLKNNHSGVKTGTKERMKLETKQRKAAKKAANPRKVSRQRSVYQQHMDQSGQVEAQHVEARSPTAQPPVKAPVKSFTEKAKTPAPSLAREQIIEKPAEPVDLWDQLESPQNNDIF